MMTNRDQPQTILIVEDDENLRLALADNLEEEGFEVHAAADGAQADAALAATTFDLIVLDIMLPDTDGYTICRSIRRRDLRSRVLMLTARSLEDDLVQGFDSGADDYLAKPYRLRELLARVKALLRRGVAPASAVKPSVDEVFEFGGHHLDVAPRRLVDASQSPVSLTRTEFDLLVYLVRNAGSVLSRRQILDEVWGDGIAVDERTVDNFVSSLKRKLRWTSRSDFAIHTVRGVGYRMDLSNPRLD